MFGINYAYIELIYTLDLQIFTANADKKFIAKKFKNYATNMGIIVEDLLVKAHHSIGMVEH